MYRQLGESDLRTLYNLLRAKFDSNSKQWQDVRSWVKQYFPKTATSATIVIRSEYNDEDYDNEIQYVSVYDANGDELVPLKDKRDTARQEMSHLSLPSGMDTTNDEMSDVTIFLGEQPIPTLFVLEGAS